MSINSLGGGVTWRCTPALADPGLITPLMQVWNGAPYASASGISTGQDVVVRFAVKPTSSILTPRATIDKAGRETEIVTKGRHDPCVGIRAVPVAEAMMACVILDHLLLHRGQIGENQGHIG